jgi:methionyl-tRNA formyltransferase
MSSSEPSPLRVLLIGRHELACRILEALARKGHIELAAIPARREDADNRAALTRAARVHSIPLLGIGKTGLSDAIDCFRPQLLVSAGFDGILTADAIARIARCINVHFGMLPRYRGSYSIPWAILNDDPEIGVTLHDMTPSMDAGAIICQERFPNDPGKSCRDLYDRAVDLGTELVVWFVERMLTGDTPTGIPQDEKLATYYSSDYPGAFKVPWRQTVTYVANYIRAAHFPPYDGAFGEIDGQQIVFDWPVGFLFDSPAVSPGTITACNAGPCVTTLNGFILPMTVNLVGRRRNFADLVNEHALLNRSFV